MYTYIFLCIKLNHPAIHPQCYVCVFHFTLTSIFPWEKFYWFSPANMGGNVMNAHRGLFATEIPLLTHSCSRQLHVLLDIVLPACLVLFWMQENASAFISSRGCSIQAGCRQAGFIHSHPTTHLQWWRQHDSLQLWCLHAALMQVVGLDFYILLLLYLKFAAIHLEFSFVSRIYYISVFSSHVCVCAHICAKVCSLFFFSKPLMEL